MDKEAQIVITLAESDYLEIRDALSSASTQALIRGLDESYEHKEGSMLRHRTFDRIRGQFDTHYKNVLHSRLKK